MSKRFKNGNGKKKTFTKQVASNTKAIKRLKNAPEIKYLNIIRSLAVSVAGQQALSLNSMIRGDEWGQRIGQKIKMKFVEINMYIDNTLAAAPNRVRVMLLMDRYPQGIPLVTNRLFHDIADNFTRQITLSDKDFRQDFIVYYDKIHLLSSNNNGNAQNERIIKIRQVLRSNTLYNVGDVGTSADIEQNALYLVTAFSNADATWYANSSLYYTDV